jgi:hypothetical protein
MSGKRRTLWTPGMPTPGEKRAWRHEGASYYVDVTEKYVPAEQLREAVEALDRIALSKPRPTLDPHDCEARLRRTAQDALDRLDRLGGTE